MLAGNTVFVLGAGSSATFGMPIGSGLLTEIERDLTFRFEFGERLLNGDPDIAARIRRRPESERRPLYEGAAKLVAALPGFNSIDDCLYTHGDDPAVRQIGKVAIARAISRCEHKSWLRHLASPDQEERLGALKRLRGGWVHSLVRLLVTGRKAKDAAHLFSDIALVTFNYERSAELAIYHLAKEAMNMSDQEAGEALAGLKIYRPYGGLGSLRLPHRNGVPFGSQQVDIFEMAESISVYTEDLGERPDLIEMADMISKADSIVFLGFGFHTQNMNLIAADSLPNHPRAIYATMTEEPLARQDVFRERVQSSLQPQGGFARKMNLTSAHDCDGFMRDYGALLSG